MRAPAVSLRWRIALIFSVLIVAIFAVSGTVQVTQQRGHLEDSLRSRVERLAEIQAGAITGALWDLNYERAGRLIKSLEKDPDFAYVRVTDPNGEVVAKLGQVTDSQDILTAGADVTRQGEVLGTLELGLSRARLNEQVRGAILNVGVIALATVGVLVAAMLFSLNRILRPVAGINHAMTRIAAGHDDVEIPSMDRRDEVGEMARTVQVFQDNRREMQAMRAEQEDIKKRADAEREQTRTELADSFEETIKAAVTEMGRAAATVAEKADGMNRAASSNTEKARSAVESSQQADENIQTVASTTEELTSSVREIAQNAQQSTQVSDDAVQRAQQTQETVSKLRDTARQISDVITLINDIAEQTNLLALNATIEAARAGESGKGFAVVAQEVKQLANQTANATDRIAGQIDEIQGATGQAVEQMTSIVDVIGRVNEYVSSIASATQEQDAATQEIARGAQAAAEAARGVSANLSEMERAAATNAQESGQASEAMNDLQRRFRDLSDEVDKFLGEIRAA